MILVATVGLGCPVGNDGGRVGSIFSGIIWSDPGTRMLFFLVGFGLGWLIVVLVVLVVLVAVVVALGARWGAVAGRGGYPYRPVRISHVEAIQHAPHADS
jgi:uncharacterized membrane protein